MSISTESQDLAQLSINTIRTLAMDGVQAANSGHPGTPMALAPVAYELWTRHMMYDPASPLWSNRDRYVLSCGHASMLLYALIHLAGIRRVDDRGVVTDELSLPLEQLKNFRQWNSRTPGHPEVKHTSGVETTTGPLGQGCGNSVGMAMAGRWLAARYNRPGFELFNYNVWTQCSDGDLMEGVACEAASLAGHLGLSNLCWLYDDNQITIEGRTSLAFSEDVATRFRGLGWHVEQVADANDRNALADAISSFRDELSKPTLIIVKSVIAYGAPNKADTADAHGAPLGDEEIKLTKQAYDWPTDDKFLVPTGVPEHFQATLAARGQAAREEWQALRDRYAKEFPELAEELSQIEHATLPGGWDSDLPMFDADAKGLATRVSAGKALDHFATKVPWLLGGSADLAPSTKTLLDGQSSFSSDNYSARNFHFGIREHAMAAAVNGMALCGLRPFGATFFVFSDYLRPSLRLAAIMQLPSIFVFTHDSIGVGEDGPTHQPVEQLSACRAIPGLVVLRPGDANEAVHAWRAALAQTSGPTALVLTRQNLPTFCREKYASAAGTARGGYVLAGGDSPPEVILLATGSEVQLAIDAHEQLTAEGVKCRVVSLPSFELFNKQSQAYRNEVLPPSVTARVAIEAGVRQCWDQYIGPEGMFVGLDWFGASAPYAEIYKQRGLTVENIVRAAQTALGN